MNPLANSENPLRCIPRGVDNMILEYCDFKDLKRLSAVDHWFRDRVLNFVRYPELFRYYCPPPVIDTQTDVVDQLDMVGCKIEMIPFVGSLAAISRMIGGIFLSIGFGVGQGVNQIKAKYAANEKELRKIKEAEKYCEREAQRAAWNILFGAYNTLPVAGSFFAKHNLNNCKYYSFQKHSIKILKGALKTIDWVSRMREHVLPNLPENIIIQSLGYGFGTQMTINCVIGKREMLENWLVSWENGKFDNSTNEELDSLKYTHDDACSYAFHIQYAADALNKKISEPLSQILGCNI